MTLLVDSDVLIDVSRGKDARLISRWTELAASESPILYSPVSAAELWAGSRSNEHDALRALFAALALVPIDAGIGALAGEYMRLYRKSHSLELADALIAASVVSANATLWTRNRKHYPMKEIQFFQ